MSASRKVTHLPLVYCGGDAGGDRNNLSKLLVNINDPELIHKGKIASFQRTITKIWGLLSDAPEPGPQAAGQ